MLQHAQSSAIAIMERAVSFLKTEQARGVPGMSDRLGNLEASLKDAPVVNIVGRAIIDYTLASTRLTVKREVEGSRKSPRPKAVFFKKSSGVTDAFQQLGTT